MPRTTDEALDRLLCDGQARAAAIDPAHALLWESVAAATVGGKRFRPALVTAAHDALGGTDTNQTIHRDHLFLVVHDPSWAASM